MRIQIRLIGNRLQLTKFQIFQRTILDFNGTAMNYFIICLVAQSISRLPRRSGSRSVVEPVE